jgi:hypothetical protein
MLTQYPNTPQVSNLIVDEIERCLPEIIFRLYIPPPLDVNEKRGLQSKLTVKRGFRLSPAVERRKAESRLRGEDFADSLRRVQKIVFGGMYSNYSGEFRSLEGTQSALTNLPLFKDPKSRSVVAALSLDMLAPQTEGGTGRPVKAKGLVGTEAESLVPWRTELRVSAQEWAQQLLKKGRQLIKAGNFAEGARVLDESLTVGGGSPGEYVKIIRLLVESNCANLARYLVRKVHGLYPHDSALCRWVNVLAEPTVRTVERRPVNKNDALRWLKANAGSHRGKWVVLSGGKLLASGDTLRGALQEAQSVGPLGDTLTHLIRK